MGGGRVGHPVLQGVEQQRCKILSNSTFLGVAMGGWDEVFAHWHCSRVIEIFVNIFSVRIFSQIFSFNFHDFMNIFQL